MALTITLRPRVFRFTVSKDVARLLRAAIPHPDIVAWQKAQTRAALDLIANDLDREILASLSNEPERKTKSRNSSKRPKTTSPAASEHSRARTIPAGKLIPGRAKGSHSR